MREVFIKYGDNHQQYRENYNKIFGKKDESGKWGTEEQREELKEAIKGVEEK